MRFLRAKPRKTTARQPAPRMAKPEAASGGLELSRLASGACLLALLGLLWLALGSDLYVVSAVTASGNGGVSLESLTAESGLMGRNAFWVNTAEARRDLMGAIPNLQRVRIDFPWPGEAVILVEERASRFMVWQDGRSCQVAGDGVVLRCAKTDQQNRELVLVDAPSFAPGDRLDSKLLEAAETLRVTAEGVAREPCAELSYSETAGFNAEFGSGLNVAYGGPDEIEAKSVALGQVLGAVSPAPKWIDVRVPNRPYYK